MYRGVAQLVARTAGGREVAGSSPVTPTKVLRLKYYWRNKYQKVYLGIWIQLTTQQF